MGQAKQRKAEIDALKTQGPKARAPRAAKLIAFGAYYRDDQDDGVSIQFSTYCDPKPGFTEFIYQQVKECTDHMLEEVQSGEITRDEIWDQLHNAIVSFNFKCFGSNQRPSHNHYKMDVIECMQEIIVIMNDIWVLQELGEIPNDEYNGMMFATEQ